MDGFFLRENTESVDDITLWEAFIVTIRSILIRQKIQKDRERKEQRTALLAREAILGKLYKNHSSVEVKTWRDFMSDQLNLLDAYNISEQS